MSECSSRLNICDHTRSHSVDVIDLFCGVGGLTHGLENAGLNVRLGVDVDPACAYPYEHNNKASFLLKSVEDLTSDDLSSYRNDRNYLLLAGCAPCQPFSTYQRRKGGPQDKRWHLINHFKRLIGELQPDFVTMENVPRLVEQDIFRDFVKYLEKNNFHVHFSIINCCDYAVPQNRKRLVLLASKLGKIKLITPFVSPEHYVTVRKAIGGLPKIKDGETSNTDPLHQSAKLSPLNRKRIQASIPGGSWKNWDKELVAACHTKDSGKSYPSVYGRMTWDDCSPTITTQYYGFGNGRFGHPEQDRALSLREGAILQSFPPNYIFATDPQQIRRKTIGRLIGNAVPVNLGRAIGESVKAHLANYSNRKHQ